MQKNAVVVGAGIAGIAAAIRLSCQGYQVSVFENNSFPGGKLSQISGNGYRFDAGPSLFTLPHLVDELFTLCGESPKNHFSYLELNAICNYFYNDGTRFTAYKTKSQFEKNLSEIGIPNQQQKAFFKQLEVAQYRYNLTAPIFIEQSLHRFKNFLNWKTLKGLLNAWKLNPFQSMNSENEARVKNPYLVQYLNRYATYNGSNPYKAPALLNMIPHLEHHLGSYFPKGGMHSITMSLYELALRQGIQFYFNHRVEEILVNEHRAEGIRIQNTLTQETTQIKSQLIVCNADIYTAYKHLLPTIAAPQKVMNQERSTSALVFYWGINTNFPQLDLHNIFFSSDYEAEFKALFEGQTPTDDPTIYINITSKYEPSDAPSAGENWFVMINVPHHRGQDWQSIAQTARKNILQKLNRLLNSNIETCIEFETVLDPVTIENRTASYGGSLYGSASNDRMAAFFRHKNFSSDVKGLYFCGGSVHPGGGIPLCLNSAKIVSAIIAEDFH